MFNSKHKPEKQHLPRGADSFISNPKSGVWALDWQGVVDTLSWAGFPTQDLRSRMQSWGHSMHSESCSAPAAPWALSAGNYWEFETQSWMKIVFLSSNLSLLYPNFLTTPRLPSEQARTCLHTHTCPGMVPLSHREYKSLHPVLILLVVCCQRSESCLIIARLLLEKVGHMCLLASWSLSDTM